MKIRLVLTFALTVFLSGGVFAAEPAQDSQAGYWYSDAWTGDAAAWCDSIVQAFDYSGSGWGDYDWGDWRTAEREAKTWFRDQIVTEEDLARYGLKKAAGWDACARDRPCVVLLHGYNSTPEQTLEMYSLAQKSNFPCATFCYPNDQGLNASAEFLSRELAEFSRQHPGRRVALVCHSMGSLVARACVENPKLDPGNIDRLIMVAPPSHGTYLAFFAVGSDLWEHWLARTDGWPWDRFRDSVIDGMGEAASDLCPNSPFLVALNSQPRNPLVKYSILLGTRGVVTAEDIVYLQDSLTNTVGQLPYAGESTRDFNALLAEMEELVEGKGDGVIAVKRGKLAGVKDTISMPFTHLAVTGIGADSTTLDVQKAIVERLE